jgi:signal transduction histidine kinase
MKPQPIISYFSDRLDNSAKVLLLIAVTVALTSLAIVLSADFVQARRMNELNASALRYTSKMKAKLRDEEEKILSIASLEKANDFVTFSQRAKRLMEQNPSYIRIELRDESGTLIGQREAASSKEVWAANSRQQLPPSVQLSFMRANEQQKVFWAHSYSPSGQSTPEMVVPSRGHDVLWIVSVDTRHWLPADTGIDISPNAHVSYSEQMPLTLANSLSVADPLDLPGINAHLVFTYVNASGLTFDTTSWTLAVLGVVLCFLLIRYALDLKRHRLAQETISRQEMALVKQSQLSTMGEVSTALAHELNQPLATIANYVAACEMRMKSQGYEDPILADALLNARKQAMRAGEVVQSIRNYLKRRPNVMTTVDVKEMLDELAPILLLSAKEHQTKMTIQSEQNLCARIDPALLEQVVLNLSRNGLEAMDGGVDANLRRLNIHAYTHTSRNGSIWLRIDVQDVGHGVSDKDAQNLFESFFTTKTDGMGIGLSLCRSVAESYGGRIRWANNPNGGATFSLYLPKLMNA